MLIINKLPVYSFKRKYIHKRNLINKIFKIMRIYNGKNSQLDLPLSGAARLVVPAHSVSKDFLPSDYFLTMIAQCYEDKDLALIVSGPWEINMCAKNPACNPMVVNTLDEAIERFNPQPKEEKVVVVMEEVETEPEVVQAGKEEEMVVEEATEEDGVNEEVLIPAEDVVEESTVDNLVDTVKEPVVKKNKKKAGRK